MSPSVLTQQPISSAEFYRLARGVAFRRMLTELRRGRVVKLGPHYIEHGRVQAKLRNALYLATVIEPTWHVLTAATISYGNGFEPLPDILVIDTSVRETPNDCVSPAAVKLVVEVTDATLSDDMGEKREDYARGGLAEYWVADVQAKTVIRHAEPSDGAYLNEAAPVPLSQRLAMLTQPKVVAKV